MQRIDRPHYTKHILTLLGKGEVIVLTGHRRAGKSCILECLSDILKEKGNVILLDMENPDNAYIEDYQQLNTWIKERISLTQHNYILIDEVQEITHFEKTLRYWVKQPNIDIVITGSNAQMLSSDIASVFAGRYLQVHILSLNYSEFLNFHKMEPSPDSLAQYLRWGGLPFLSLIPSDDTRTRTDYLGSIYDTIFVKDIIGRRPTRNIALFDKLAHFVAENTGKLFSANSISKYLKNTETSVSSNTVAGYMDTLCATYMLDRVQRYDIKGKHIFEQQEKYYFEDLGIRNHLCQDKRQIDMEKVFENAVYLKLKNLGYTVYVGQLDGKEIDFVALYGDEKSYIQVSMQIQTEETYEREFGNLKRIKDNYPKYIITMDPMAGLVNDSGIKVIQASDFLLQDEL